MNYLPVTISNVTEITATNQSYFSFENITQCNLVHSYDSYTTKCLFVQDVASCNSNNGFINYITFTYCTLGSQLFSVILLVLWILVLFIILGVTADEFLCPSLLVISRTLRLSDNIAGVTILAFGNGAPDIFSAIAGIDSSDPDIVIGDLLGGGIFDLTIVAGAILLISDFRMCSRPCVRDILFYMLATFLIWLIYFQGIVTLYYSIGFIVLYIFYIVIVVGGAIIYNAWKKRKARQNHDENNNIEDIDNSGAIISAAESSGIVFQRTYFRQTSKKVKSLPTELGIGDVVLSRFNFPAHNSLQKQRHSSLGITNLSSPQQQPHEYHHHGSNAIFSIARYHTRKNTISDESFVEITHASPKAGGSFFKLSQSNKEAVIKGCKEFLIHISPIDFQSWREDAWYIKIFSVIKSPIYFILLITNPVVDEESEKNNWCKWLTMLQIIIGPQAFVWMNQLSADGNPIQELCVLALSIVFNFIVQFTSTLDQPPIYHWVFGYLGFLMSISWIQCTANEVVNALSAIGLIFNLSDIFLGMTVLAWGNCLGDFVANTAMARHGFPKMGLSACVGGPLLNAFLGIGIPFTYMFLKDNKKSVKVTYQSQVTLLYSVVSIALVSTLIFLIVRRFQTHKWFGYLMIVTYLFYFLFALLQEFKVVP